MMTGINIDGADVRADFEIESPSPNVLPEGSTEFVRPDGIATAGEDVDANLVPKSPATGTLPEGPEDFNRPRGIATAGEDADVDLSVSRPADQLLPVGTSTFDRPRGIATMGADAEADLSLRRSGAGRFDLTAAVLSFVPGSDGSAYPSPVDAWFHGGGVDELPQSLRKALNDERTLPEYDEPFPRFRVNNALSIEYGSSDGKTLDHASVSADPFDLAPVTLVGDPPLRTNFRDDFENSDAISEPWDYQKPLPFGPFVAQEEVTVDGVEGIRASVILGGRNPYVGVLQDYVHEQSVAALLLELGLEANAAVGEYVRSNPMVYSFLEIVLLADGSQVARLWDASPFPRHAVYLFGSKLGTSSFDLGDEGAIDSFLEWVTAAGSPVLTPGAPGIHLGYESMLAGGDGPLTEHVVAGERLDEGQLTSVLDEPLVPEFPGEGTGERKRKERVVEPEETITLENDHARVEIGARGSTSWQFDDSSGELVETLFEEFFVIEDGNGNRVISYEIDAEDVEITKTSETVVEAELVASLGGRDVRIDRRLRLDPCRPLFELDYDVIKPNDDERIPEVELYQYSDFDVTGERNGDRAVIEDDIASVTATTADGLSVGFVGVDAHGASSDAVPDAHQAGPARSTREQFHEEDVDLSGANAFPESSDESGDPAVVQAWKLGYLDYHPKLKDKGDKETGLTVRFAATESRDDVSTELQRPVSTVNDIVDVLDVDLPPTAVETDEPVTFTADLYPGCLDADDFGGTLTAEVTRRGDQVANPIEIDLSENVTETTDRELDAVRISAEVGPAEALVSSTPPEGIGFLMAIEVTVLGETLEELSFPRSSRTTDLIRTFAFETVDRVGMVAAHASDTSPTRDGRELFEFLRNRAEFVNEHYASGLGNMGAKGFDVDLLNERQAGTPPLSPTWLELPKVFSKYHTNNSDELPDENVREFVGEALRAFNPADGVDVANYDTGMVVNPKALSRANWQGSIPPVFHIDIPRINFEYRTPTSLPDIDIRPYDLSGGDQIDSIYATVEDDAWSHEFGHAMGPGLQVGFPEMYHMDHPLYNYGNIGNWGVMGGGDFNHVVSSFVRGFVGDQPYDFDGWVDWDTTLHILDDVSIDVGGPLSEFELGDDANRLLSAYYEFAVDVTIDYPDLGDLDPGIDVEIEESSPRFGFYILENREGRRSGIEDPANDKLVTAPPTSSNGSDYQTGIALYRFQFLDLEEFDVDLWDVLDRHVDVEVSDESFQLEYLPSDKKKNPKEKADRPTNISLSPDDRTYEDSASASKFHLSKTRDEGGPEVTVERDVESLIDADGEVIDDVVRFVVDTLDEFEDRLREAYEGATSGDGRRPKLDVYAETPDGRRSGLDPETGTVVNEIDGARVDPSMIRTTVSVPASIDVEFKVSDARLRAYFQERGVEVPEVVAYERTIIVDNDATIVDRDGIPYIDGRTVHRGPAAVGDDQQPATQSVSVDVRPDGVNSASNGEFITVFFGIGDLGPDGFSPATVALEQVPAVSDDKYGFVKNPPTRTRNGETQVMVKFRRDRVVEALGEGTHEVQVSGLVENVVCYGRPELKITDPGKGNGSDGGKGDDSGNGP